MKLQTLSLVALFLSTADGVRFTDRSDQTPVLYRPSTKIIRNCGKENDLLSIDYIALRPDPPRKGEPLHVDFKGFLKEEIGNGTYVDVVVKYRGMQMLHKKYDFCDEADKFGERCPFEAGEYRLSKDVDLPDDIQYIVHIEIVTPEDKRVTCVVARTKL
ncbi:ML domain-containing protein [Radiomyces spectabilis]|uniref:ML domain-containing protein n=1 Tax=Radiomyces spectabilis TaxID=64574 RepID=UPI00221FB69A|nr:ML domain-containing protein [Radiomyces spectabilis]KAI8377738.1 ML domain-containing protein [Radiomyces spectabilis]